MAWGMFFAAGVEPLVRLNDKVNVNCTRTSFNSMSFSLYEPKSFNTNIFYKLSSKNCAKQKSYLKIKFSFSYFARYCIYIYCFNNCLKARNTQTNSSHTRLYTPTHTHSRNPHSSSSNVLTHKRVMMHVVFYSRVLR